MNWAAILVVMKLTKFGVFLSAIALIAIGKTTPSYAGTACTPGIPCTGYDINATPGAATDQTLNAWKSGGLPSDAPPFTNTSCDGNYMNQMIGEAFIHAQREIAMNAQIIRKPDSVLEYTCFDRYVAHAANYAGTFSETTAWQNRSTEFRTNDETVTENWSYVLPGVASHLDNALNLVITNAMSSHIRNNFAHRYLGGASGIDNNMNLTNVTGGSYSCNHMDAVWDLAKCVNFGEDDNFLSFGQLVTGDPRQLTAACRGAAAPALNAGAPSQLVPIANTYVTTLDALGVMTISETDPCPAAGTTGLVTNDQIRLSNNCEMLFSAYELAKSYFEYTRDPYYVLDDLYAVLSSFPSPAVVWVNPCGDPIPTGVRVPYYYIDTIVLGGVTTAVNAPGALAPFGIAGLDYEEHVCPNPSCSFIPGVNLCVPPPP